MLHATEIQAAPINTVDLAETSSFAQRHLQRPYIAAISVRSAIHNAADSIGDKIAGAVDYVRDSSLSLPKSSGETTARVAASALALAGSVYAIKATVGTEKAIAGKAKASQIIPPRTFNVFTRTTPEAILAAVQQTPTEELSKVGTALATTIHSVDFKQTTTNIESTSIGSVKASYTCPSPSSPLAPTSLQSAEVFPGNRANVTPCPSPLIVTESKVNFQDPAVATALRKYMADPFRNGEPWVGNGWSINLFLECPDRTQQQEPRTSLKYNASKGKIVVTFNGVRNGNYCDRVGSSREGITTEVAVGKSKHYKSIGKKAMHIDGIPEVLVSEYGLPAKYARTSITIPGIGRLCARGKDKPVYIRAKVQSKFTGMKSQDFQMQGGKSDGMRSSASTHTSKRIKVCS